MTDLPNSWTRTDIVDVLEPNDNGRPFQQGWSPRCEAFPASEGGWGVLKTTAIQPGDFWDHENKALPGHLSPRPHLEVRCGDLLITCAGPRSRCGVVCLVDQTRSKLMMSGKMYRFRPRRDVLNSKYLAYFLQTHEAQLAIDRMKTGISDSGLNLTHDRVAKLRVPLAPINEQRRIVAKIEELFSELDSGVENLHRAREQLQVYRHAVLKNAFQGVLTERWRQENEAAIGTPEQLLAHITQLRRQRYDASLAEWETRGNGTKAKRPRKPDAVKPVSPDAQARLPELPEGWCYVRIADLCDVVRGGSPRPAGDPRYYGGAIPFLKVADLTRTAGAYVDTHSYSIKEAGLTKTRLVEPPILMLSNSGATLGVPKICRIRATFNDGIAAFLGIEEEALLYHYYFWTSKTSELRGINQGAAQPNLNTDLIGDVVVPICSPLEMQAVANEIASALSKCEQLLTDIEDQLAKAAVLRQAILAKAFAGELVEQDAGDEPASAQLERSASENGQAVQQNGARRAGRRRKTGT